MINHSSEHVKENLEAILYPDHLQDLRKSGLSDETIFEAGIKSLSTAEVDKTLRYSAHAKSAYEIPYSSDYSRFKMFYADENKVNPETGEERPKYLQKKDSGNRLFIPQKVKPILDNLAMPVYVVEGEKKSLKATQEGLPCISISGLWSWSNGNKELLEDFNQIVLDGRTIYVIPDSGFQEPDRHGKPKNLRQAIHEMGYKLIDRGAKVAWVELGLYIEGKPEVKLDDFLCNHSIEDFKKLPTHPIRKLTISETIDNATPGMPDFERKELLKRISEESHSESEKELHLKRLKKKTDITLTAMRKDVRAFGGDEGGSETHAEKLIGIASGYTLFHDDVKEGYAHIDNVAVKIRSGEFKRLLSKILWETEQIAPNNDSFSQALNVIEAKAVHNGECIKLFNRVAEHEGIFYYDLCDGKAVRISRHGWEVTDKFPILFKRYSHQQAQVEPKKGGNIQKLFKYINVRDEHKLLTLVLLISCFVPDIAHPIFHFFGDRGAGKTLMSVFFKLLVDPSKLSVMITPRNPEELVQILEHHYLCTLDNLSTIPDWLSDLLCQVCTGGGFSKRRLYSDDEDIIYQIKRCIGINGINAVVARPDLMDRTILLHMERIEPSERREEKVLMKEFEQDRPYLLGCIFDVLSKAGEIYPSVKLDNLPRMADFMTWGVAITQALGYKTDDFVNAYQKNIENQNSEIINSNTLAQAVLAFMQDRESWRGTVKQAYEELEKLEKLVTISKEDKTFPKHPNKLRSHLNRIKSNLLDYRVKFTIEDYDTRHRGCFVSFQKIGDPASIPHLSSSMKPSKDGSCGIHEDNEDKKHTLGVSEKKEFSDDIITLGDFEIVEGINDIQSFEAVSNKDIREDSRI